MPTAPFRLHPMLVPRIWGRHDLSPWFTAATPEAIGEAWLTGPGCVVQDGPFAGKTLAEACAASPQALLGTNAEGNQFPLLLKLLFPDDWLSVQVHPNDEQAAASGSLGKTECWYVLDAKPGATVALGFRDPKIAMEDIRRAIDAKELESLLHYEPVAPGEMIFVDANTVHAIGPGVTIFEIQQTSDITYRLYDYGRPRELHLDQGLAVLKTATRAGKVPPTTRQGFHRLIAEQYFSVDRFELAAGDEVNIVPQGKPQVAVLLAGRAQLEADQVRLDLRIAETVIIPAEEQSVTIRAAEKAVVCLCQP